MAPILATATGVTPQILDDADLKNLVGALHALSPVPQNLKVSTEQPIEPGIESLCTLLEPWSKEWLFEEQVDLHEWIHPLNVMDAALTWILRNYGSNILLLDPVQRSKNESDERPVPAANNMQQIHECPISILHNLSIILQFTAALLRNSISKSLYASVPAVADLLAAADDTVADCAVAVLTALSLPPALHKQQAPEHAVHTTALHQNTNSSEVHDRLTATARAWGTRAMGLGLYVTVTADDSVHGQGGLPSSMGQVNFCYYKTGSCKNESIAKEVSDDESTLQEINLTLQEMIIEPSDASSMSDGSSANPEDTDHEASNKRRRVTSRCQKETKSTAELFFLAIEKAGGKACIPNERLFSLLADIRLARSFHSQAARVQAVERRLQALITILHAHPSTEIMSGYFQAQPELTVEIVDLLRPTVSVANVSAVPSAGDDSTNSRLRPDAISSLVSNSTQNVPYNIRMLALEALTALVSRRDSSAGALSGSARLTSVLTELGVGKGQYLGLLPTLIRYSLAALNSVASNTPVASKDIETTESFSETLGVGLAFAEATMSPPLDRQTQVERALLLIDNVLTLTSAVVGTPTGTPALVDCGLIPALLSTVSMDPGVILSRLLPNTTPDRRVKALLRFVTAQAVQILEGAIVTHNNALSAFHDLQGVEIITTRLSREIACTRQVRATEEMVVEDADGDVEMSDAAAASVMTRPDEPRILSSQRVILFSIVTCLTVVFHQESTSSSTITPTGGSQLRKKELTDALIEILDDVQSYGGHLASLIATLLSDVMNNDPHVVHYVHQSGIANSFLKMVQGNKLDDGSYEPIIPPVPELVMAIPNVLSALSLTEDGAKAVYEANPFPSLLRLFHHPKYSMPNSRCLLNEMTAIVGTGLDEIMRHVERLKPLVLTAIAEAMAEVVKFADDLVSREELVFGMSGHEMNDGREVIENERSFLIQYVLNFGQLLEQILVSEDHSEPFVDAGGLDALLKLFPSSMPSHMQFLAYLSCLSSPSVSTLHHSTTEETLSLALKSLEMRFDSQKLIKKLIDVATSHLDALEESQKEIVGDGGLCLLLDKLPHEELYKLSGSDAQKLKCISKFLRNVTNVQWITSIISNAIKAACQRNNEAGTGWSRNEREWKNELSSKAFEDLVGRLSNFYRDSLFEVCRVRTEEKFEKSVEERQKFRTTGITYRLRIVCPEGAVVRDGIEIDSCANVGSMEMGDIVDSFDRCINSSGILRYRTNRGWVSEMTRGHGREPIAEVISVTASSAVEVQSEAEKDDSRKRIEAGIPGLRSLAVGVLARGQSSYSDFFGSLSKLIIQGIRNLPGRAITFDEGDAGAHVASIMKFLSTNLRNGFGNSRVAVVSNNSNHEKKVINEAGAAMYLGCYLSHVHACLFDDKREVRMVNFTLLVSLIATDRFVRKPSSSENTETSDCSLGLFDAIRFILNHGLNDFSNRIGSERNHDSKEPQQRVDRSVAASFPPLMALLRRLMSTPFSSSPSASIMSRMKWKEVSRLLGDECLVLAPEGTDGTDSSESFFTPESFIADLQFAASNVIQETWNDSRLMYAPPYLVHPLASLVGDIMLCLDEASKKKSSTTTRSNNSSNNAPRQAERVRLSELTRMRQEDNVVDAPAQQEEQGFEPSDDAVNQLMEMGFSRDQALDALESTQSNRIETAMDYALTNPPPSPSTAERRRTEREERARRREEMRREQERGQEGEQQQSSNSNSQEQEQGGGQQQSNISDGNLEASEDTINAAGQDNNAADERQSDAMEVDEKETNTESEKSPENANELNTLAKAKLSSWLDDVPRVSCDFLASMTLNRSIDFFKSSDNPVADKDGDGETEALTVVLCSFLLDLCHRYPEKRSVIVSQVFSGLKQKLTHWDENGKDQYSISKEDEASAASLCHATVLIIRALPKTRLYILKQGLVRALVSCIKSFVCSGKWNKKNQNETVAFPVWLAPSLLLLDIMAQPIVAFSDEELVRSIADSDPDIEFTQLQTEHKEQANELFRMANNWFAESPGTKEGKAGKANSPPENNGSPKDEMDVESSEPVKSEDENDSPFSSIPAYFPLLSLEATNSCLEICQALLGTNNEETPRAIVPPGVAHATLLLLLRLLRTPRLSSQCLSIGVAEAVLSLPKESTFTGNTGLVTLIFRRLLEDESTLQAAMETEIRGTVTKLYAKKNSSSKEEKANIALASFFEAVTPLLCRNPSSFLKAMALSVAVECSKEDKVETKIFLLTENERSRRLSLLEETKMSSDNPLGTKAEIPSREAITPRQKRLSSGSRGKAKSTSKSSKRHSTSKKGKKDKNDTPKASPHIPPESPATHVTCLLINSVVTSYVSGDTPGDNDSFLWTGDLLEVLADLILAVPACASAVHNYRPHKGKDKPKKSGNVFQVQHALGGCNSPPKTFVTFLLHCLLPQDRWTIRNDPKIWERRKEENEEYAKDVKSKKKAAYRIMKLSQTAARVLIALVVRPGEGRKRVIADLVFALSGGRMGHGSSQSLAPEVRSPSKFSNAELHALYAWGELCLGLAAPRSNGKNLEGASSLSIDNVRLMLEYGLAHSLLFAIHKVKLNHPMASTTCGALLLPLEVLTRPVVTDAIKDLVKREKESKEGDGLLGMPSSDQEKESSQIMDESGFGEDGEAVGHDLLLQEEEHNMEDVGSEDGGGDGGDGSEEEETNTSEGSEEEESDEEDDEEDDDSGVEDMNDDEEQSEVEDEDEASSEEVEEEGGWDVDYNDNFPADGPGLRQEFEDAGDEGTERIDENLDEGWTRIESSGFGGMLLGGRRNGFGAGNVGARDRGFIDAAENMIGTLLRSGDISGEALADIEGTLGIRILAGGRPLHARLRSGDIEGSIENSIGLRVLGMDGNRQTERNRTSEVMGTLPHIHQRSQPDVGYAAFGRSGQWIEISSMEYVYCGPSVTGGSRNYDLNTPFHDDSDAESHFTLTQLDLHLFPGGPAAAASARTQHSLHPLLCGVDLPPVNSLVSDLLPHGVRATRRGQMTTRRPGDWSNASFSSGGYLVSTSNGNIIRSNRAHAGAALGNSLGNRNVTGPVGWTDDGLPVDATVEEFSSAFRRALGEAARSLADQADSTTVPAAVNNEANNETTMGDDDANEGTSGATEAPINASNGNDEEESAAGNPVARRTVASLQAEEQESIRSDGDRVASSLAAGLRLSPRSEESALTANSQPSNHASPEVPDSTRQESPNEPGGNPATNTTEAEPTSSSLPGADALMEDAPQAEVAQGTSNDSVPADSSQPAEDSNDAGANETQHSAGNQTSNSAQPNSNGLVCPPDFDPEVFNSLPREMQQDCVDQYNATQELAAQLDGSSLDPEVLAALPEDVRREVIEQERRERRMREQEQAPADPAHAEEMDNANFVASLSPELREEILLTADETFLSSLPPNIVAEAQILRERASTQHRRIYDNAINAAPNHDNGPTAGGTGNAVAGTTTRRRQRSGKLRVESERSDLVYKPNSLPPMFGMADMKAFIRLLYLLSPVRPPRILQKLFQNLSLNSSLRAVLSTAFIKLLHEDGEGARLAVESLQKEYGETDSWRRSTDELFSTNDDFPPHMLLGAASDVPNVEVFNLSMSASLMRRKQGIGTAASMAANLPKSAGGPSKDSALPPVVAVRLIETILHLCKSSPRFCLHSLVTPMLEMEPSEERSTCFEKLLELLDKPMYAKSSANLDQLLTLLESAVSPLSHISKHTDEEYEVPQTDIDAAAAAGKEWVDVPRITVSQGRLQLLCSILRMETCRDTAFTKVNTIVRRLCRIETNRGYVLAELASVAHALGGDAMRDLKALRIRMDSAVTQHRQQVAEKMETESVENASPSEKPGSTVVGTISSSVTLSTSTSELKLLRVLQTLQALCNDGTEDHSSKKNEGSVIVTEELVHLLRQMHFDDLWDELSSCLKVVQVLEGVKTYEEEEQKASEEMENNDEGSADGEGGKTKKLRNSAAGLLTRFLPSIEAFFVANASATRTVDSPKDGDTGGTSPEEITLDNLVGGKRLMDFVTTNKVLLNALIRNNSSLLDKGLRALVQVPRCRAILDFDVKRQWFKTQMRRLRQQASRRHGSLRLHIRRKYVFEDAYHQLRLRNADEMRGRLHITFRNEEGVDAGGLSREFFGILAKEIFNPNYALFTSTEDGCTFQPNPNSSINPDHLSYFRFVGRIVGKAVADGFLLDAHFTRSLYKHMLGLEPTHHDMEAIDPDYYRNLKTILEFDLADIGLDLTFSIQDNSFGRSQVIDLIPNGRNIPVTEENKEEYVRKVCQHRMTTAIKSQIKSYLDGFYELVSPELVAIFNPRELELLISGLPDIDVHDLKKNTDYVGWKITDKEIEWFWSILFSLSRNEKAAFLQFVTGSSKVPLAGFSELQGMRGVQKFSIHKAAGSKGALMSAHTCFNSLDLPSYSSEEEMREKLLYAINEGVGAFLFA